MIRKPSSAGAGLTRQRMCIEIVHTDYRRYSGRAGRLQSHAAFDTESQLFLDEALAEAGVDAKVRRIVYKPYLRQPLQWFA